MWGEYIYDDFINLFEELESDEFAEKYSEAYQKKIAHFLAYLARVGTLAKKEIGVLEEDIAEFLNALENDKEEGYLFSAGQ